MFLLRVLHLERGDTIARLIYLTGFQEGPNPARYPPLALYPDTL